MVPLVSQNDLVMVNIYTCFQTPYIRFIRKKATFVSRLQITEITIDLFFFFLVTSKNMFSFFFHTPEHAGSLSHKLLGNFSATFEIFGNFLEFWQLLEFSATLGFLRFFEATFFTF